VMCNIPRHITCPSDAPLDALQYIAENECSAIIGVLS
jgi:hypothetical protein